uniref:Uncharacterized protein n=1 Tax=Meloidogyne enterolobii TaxID=390850 RepID=A0A6V7XRI7_MELEN|nr:unnamed protein product [Meloidogyne enterolobii]
MTEEGASNSDLIKLQTKFNDLQIKFIEEKEKAFNLEKKCFLLENELKEMDKKIKKINSDNENKIEELIEENNKIKNFLEGIKKEKEIEEKEYADYINSDNYKNNTVKCEQFNKTLEYLRAKHRATFANKR